jgi:hypothetical protein
MFHCLKDVFLILPLSSHFTCSTYAVEVKILRTLKSPVSLSGVWTILVTQNMKERTRNPCAFLFFFSKQVCRLPLHFSPTLFILLPNL